MNDGRAVPRGSKPSSRPFALFTTDGIAGPALNGSPACDADFPKGCAALIVAECRGDWNAGVFGVGGLDAGAGAGERGDGVCLMNIDFVPSMNRPPRGGPAGTGGDGAAGGAGREGIGDEGPAPGDCGGSGFVSLTEGKLEACGPGVDGTDRGGWGD